ncbi:MAG: class I SAM-dependent methyltransferase [Spirulina sp.]
MNSQKMDSFLSIKTHMTSAELLLLKDLVSNFNFESNVVEIGSYLGASTCSLAKGVKRQGGKVYAVDTWTNMAMSEGVIDTFDQFLENIEPYKDIIHPLKGLSEEIAKNFDVPIDLLFIDGDHSYEGAYSDLKNWLPKVKDLGIVVCHDFNWAEGVRRAIRELLAPLQIDGGRTLDGLYWTRILNKKENIDPPISVSIAIPTYQRSDLLIEAIDSILRQFEDKSFEILVMDNDCDPKVAEKISNQFGSLADQVKYVPVPNLGLHYGRNQAAIESKGNIIVFIDDDVIVPPGWLKAICAPFDNPQVGAVGGKTLPQWDAPPPDWLEAVPKDYFSLLDLGDIQREMQWPETPYGCNMAYRRELILTLGGFPPDGVGGGWIEWWRGDGETGFAKRVYDEGFKIIYSPEAWLYHRIPAKRQTLEFVRRRAIKGAISSAYSELKYSPERKFLLPIHIFKHVVKAAIAGSKRLVTTPKGIQSWLKHDTLCVHHLISALYKTRFLIDPQLRKWVYNTQHWDKP